MLRDNGKKTRNQHLALTNSRVWGLLRQGHETSHFHAHSCGNFDVSRIPERSKWREPWRILWDGDREGLQLRSLRSSISNSSTSYCEKYSRRHSC